MLCAKPIAHCPKAHDTTIPVATRTTKHDSNGAISHIIFFIVPSGNGKIKSNPLRGESLL